MKKRMICRFMVNLLLLGPIPAEQSAGNRNAAETGHATSVACGNVFDARRCTCRGIPLKGRVKIVTAFPDFKIKAVTAFPDIKVQTVTSHPQACGQWQFVDAFPDFTVQYVDAFPDFTVQFVEHFPGTK
jgi:hypothetical protein